MNNILIAGGTGLIGSKLIKKLKQKNINVVLLSTQLKPNSLINSHHWNPSKEIFPKLDLKGIDACINFCGTGIFDKKFTPERKRELLKSRIAPIYLLKSEFEKQNVKIPMFISASATGYYEDVCLNETYENSTSGDGFISKLVDKWEDAANSCASIAEKICIFRIGIVMAKEGGFLDPLRKSIGLFAGAVPGNGKQLQSWIHIDDLVDMIVFALDKKLEGTYNAVAPQPETMGNITSQLARLMKRPLWLPNIPVWALNIIFGKERAKLLLVDQNISSRKIREAGFKFRFENSQTALADVQK